MDRDYYLYARAKPHLSLHTCRTTLISISWSRDRSISGSSQTLFYANSARVKTNTHAVTPATSQDVCFNTPAFQQTSRRFRWTWTSFNEVFRLVHFISALYIHRTSVYPPYNNPASIVHPSIHPTIVLLKSWTFPTSILH